MTRSDAELAKVQLALLELFATVDDVFTEPDAFSTPWTIRASLGRCYRSWKHVRAQLDSEFNERIYDHSRLRQNQSQKPKLRRIKKSPGRLAATNRTFSSLRMKTSEMSRLSNALRESK